MTTYDRDFDVAWQGRTVHVLCRGEDETFEGERRWFRMFVASSVSIDDGATWQEPEEMFGAEWADIEDRAFSRETVRAGAHQ